MPKKSGQSSPSSSLALSKKASSPSAKVERGGSTLPIFPFAVSGGGASTRSDAKFTSPVDSDGSSDSNASDNGLDESSFSVQAGSAEGPQFSSLPPVSSLSNGAAEENISDCDAGHQADLGATGRVSLDQSTSDSASGSDAKNESTKPMLLSALEYLGPFDSDGSLDSNASDNGRETQGLSKGKGWDQEGHFDAQSSDSSDDESSFSVQAGSAKGAQCSSPPPVSSLSSEGGEEVIPEGGPEYQADVVAPGSVSLYPSTSDSASGSDAKNEPTKPMLFSALEYLARPFLGALNILWEITGFLIKLFSLGTVDLSAQEERPVDSMNFKNHGNSAKSVNDKPLTSLDHTPTVTP